MSLSGNKGIVIKDSSRSTIAKTLFKESIADALWSGDDQSILIMTGNEPEGTGICCIYRYQWKNNKQDLIAVNTLPEWDKNSASGRYVICGQKSKTLTAEMVSQTAVRNPESIIFLDAKTLTTLFTTGENSGSYTLSPDMNSVAYIELAKDEYGDYFKHDLKIADIKTGKVMNPASGRRSLKYIWAGNRAIVYVEPDKYDLLSVRFFDMNSGNTKTFISNLSVPAIKLVAYDVQTGILYYKILDTYLSSSDDPICWAVSLGKKPVSSEQKSFPMPKSDVIRRMVMSGTIPSMKGIIK